MSLSKLSTLCFDNHSHDEYPESMSLVHLPVTIPSEAPQLASLHPNANSRACRTPEITDNMVIYSR